MRTNIRFPLPLGEQSLQDFLNDASARGVAFFAGNIPFLQLHLFPDDYSLIWESEPGQIQSSSILIDALAQVASIDSQSRTRRFDLATVSTVVLSRGRDGLSEQSRQVNLTNSPGGLRIAQTEQYFSQIWGIAVSFHGELSAALSSLTFSLWSDLAMSRRRPIETGVTASYGTLASSVIADLVARTSRYSSELDRSDLSVLVERIQAQYEL